MPYIRLLFRSYDQSFVWQCGDCGWIYPLDGLTLHECWVPSDMPEVIIVSSEFTTVPWWRQLPNGVIRASRHDRVYCRNPHCLHSLSRHVFQHGRWACFSGYCMCFEQLRELEIRYREEDLSRVRDIEDLEDQFEPRPE